MEFKDGKWIEIEQDISGVLRFPHILRMRDDKDPIHRDVGIEQLPLKQEGALTEGKHIKVITGQTGKVIGLVPKSSDSGQDFAVVIKWDTPLFEEHEVSEVHPTEILEVM
jgi:hypothetical protein